MLEHGGNLRDAQRHYGRSDWIDLSTGINPLGYPVPPLAPDAWHRLPEPDPALAEAACAYYGARAMLPVAGTQAAIQALPRLRAPSRVTVAAPSYAEHAHHWSQHGHTLRQVGYPMLGAAIGSSDVVVVCNPNNPTGARVSPAVLLAWATELGARGGWLVVDEAFGDTAPELSVAANADMPGLIVLRSVGKFFGLADLLGPWAVSGPAQEIGLTALRDTAWQQATAQQLARDGARLRALLAAYGIEAAGTPLFHWWGEARPEAFHEHMARHAIWVRLFRQAARGIRLGLPSQAGDWDRLEHALHTWNKR